MYVTSITYFQKFQEPLHWPKPHSVRIWLLFLGITETDGLHFNFAEFTDNSDLPSLSMFTLAQGGVWSEDL